ncbi:MAG: OprO/OprP family phosphate-selective porin [Bacteroidales bacterium]|nr:OprO/OprP family phosphate-selective porin [Bacteroidales bacterium]MCM1147606.1 OprO/OprP family phosphate-selective porin [Bacteroidales bacterium]MCM1206397.1 OprO/OprP family phosphate-selective porin [Bacillota bacterium]MCM1509131.1 OprO/OprP family phosphate-selective porin [Clostridium sp.]
MMKKTGTCQVFSRYDNREYSVSMASRLGKYVLALAVFFLPPATFADDNDGFVPDEKLEEGFLTHYVNEAVAREMGKQDKSSAVNLSDYVSPPKFGGYFICKYSYSSEDGKEKGDGFSQRYIRLYVDGTILKVFAYRIQFQTMNDKFHVKDYFIEWQKFKEFRVKLGQFKRAFSFENPMNPWDVGAGNYSQLVLKLAGTGDFPGEASSGRDQGMQVQGDLLPIGKDKHSLIHYQLMVANGQGLNSSDANKRKDVLGTLQVQPVRGLVFGFFGWTGSYTIGDVTADRERYAISAKYDFADWTFRTEYAHSTGYRLADFSTDENGDMYVSGGTGRADAWYATVGVPCTSWLKTYVKYDVYRNQATWSSSKSIYSVAPNIRLHKNLMFQPQFNYVHDRNLDKADYCELWLEAYVRF